MRIIDECHHTHGVAIDKLCNVLNLSRATYYRRNQHQGDKTDLASPANALNKTQQKEVLDILNGERFVDKNPYQVYYSLLDEGRYYCSPRTMYRLLTANNGNIDRRDQRSHKDAIKPELIATEANTVWSWDITKLLSVNRLEYYYLYVILDIYSRYVVGWMLHDAECKIQARKLIQESALKQGILPDQLTLHADNGSSMTSHTVSQLLEHLGITKTHNRPYTSNDNPYSESQFKTLKYHPEFPARFSSIKEAENFCKTFFAWYNNQHYHSGICWLTPCSVHYKQAESILDNRHQVLLEAFKSDPIRFNGKMPKRKNLPDAVYINPPQVVSLTHCKQEAIMA